MVENFQVIEGAESFFFKGSETGILLSHGFIGTPQSVRFLGEELAKRGYTVMAPRLKGHGTHYLDMEQCRYMDWYESLAEGYEELSRHCTKIIIMGQSMGGTLALWLAAQKQEVDGVVLINPALTIPAFDYVRQEADLRFIDEDIPDIKAKNIHEITYTKAPVKAIRQLQKLMSLTPEKLKDVHCPVLGFKSAIDHVVPPENTDFIMEQISSVQKESITLHDSYHVASMDNDKELIVKKTHSFIERAITIKRSLV